MFHWPNLKIFDINNNSIEIIPIDTFQNNMKLKKLNLKQNKLTRIESNNFKGLYLLHELNLMKNSIQFIHTNGFDNTNIKKIIFTINRMSNQMISSLINSLKPITLKTGGKVNIYFYESIYIENRVDLNCEKTFWFMRNKIFYNFFYEYDMINFLQDCKNKSQYLNAINEYKNDDIENNSSSIFNYTLFLIIFTFISFNIYFNHVL